MHMLAKQVATADPSQARLSTHQCWRTLATSSQTQSHVAQLISQVTGRLQAQAKGSGSSPDAHQQQLDDLPLQPASKSHVSELVSTFKKTLNGPAGGTSSNSSPAHGPTPRNTPLARKAVGTFFTQQQQTSHVDETLAVPQQPSSSEPAAAAGPQIIHVSYSKAAPFKAVPGASRVAAVAHQLEGPKRTGSTSAASAEATAACARAYDTASINGNGISSQGSIGSHTSDVLPTAATPAVSNDGMNARLLPPSRKPQVVAARLSSITLEGAKAVLGRTASAEVAASLASDNGQNMNPLYRPSSKGVSLTETVGTQN
jgi:hypothetical protein